MDLAYIDKLVKYRNAVRYFVVRQVLFDITVDARRMKANDSKETVRAFLIMITKQN